MITALKADQPIDTRMGLTPSGGFIMGTRSGDLDPGVLVYLMREKKFDAAASNPDARLAIEMFCVSVRKPVAAMIARHARGLLA